MDAYDPAISTGKKFRSIPFDILYSLPDFGQPTNLPTFGVAPLYTIDGFGNKIRTWHFNISRCTKCVDIQKTFIRFAVILSIFYD